MKRDCSWRVRVQILLGVAIVIAMVVVRGTNAAHNPVHLTTDWSHRHLIFSPPHDLMQQFKLSSNPRYVQQWIRRNAEKQGGPEEWRWRRASENPKRIEGDWSEDMGAGATVGAGMYPAKFSYDATTANCSNATAPAQPDFVVYNTSLAGSGSQATIVAFDNLYSSCSGTVPKTYWAYNTSSTTDAVSTSPTLSGDGSQVAFIQSTGVHTSGTATLVILRWAANSGTLGSPAIPTEVAPGSYPGCTAPCMTRIPFSALNGPYTTSDTRSSPFYDFANDVIYVGDDDGYLHKFTNVFKGIPGEVTSTGFWPANVDSGNNIFSPVFDEGSNQVYVCDRLGDFYRMDATNGGSWTPTGSGVVFTPQLASSGNGFDDAPLVDSTTGKEYVFARADTTSGEAGVFQFDSSFGYGDNGTEAIVSNDSTGPETHFFVGDFDNAYYNSSVGTGNMYVCSTYNGFNTLWQIPIASGVMGTPVHGPTLTTVNVACSPPTEFFNPHFTNGGANPGGTDFIFVSVANSAVTTPGTINCPSNTTGCIMSFDITKASSWGSGIGTIATASVAGGTSGIVVDNSVPNPSGVGATGASQVYFTPLADQTCTTSGGMGGCAIQASQSGLK